MTKLPPITEADFVKQIIVNANALSNHLTKPNSKSKTSLNLDGYLEFYVFTGLVNAMKKKNFHCLFFNRDPMQNFVVAQAGHEIYSDFSFVKFVKQKCDAWSCREAHISLFIKGASGVKQEADVAMFPIANGDYYRKNRKTFECVQRDLVKKEAFRRLIFFAECKLHASLGLTHPRSLIGSFIDLKPQKAILISNSGSNGAERLLTATDGLLNVEQYSTSRISSFLNLDPRTSNTEFLDFLSKSIS